jgi:hypothetical protein
VAKISFQRSSLLEGSFLAGLGTSSLRDKTGEISRTNSKRQKKRNIEGMKEDNGRVVRRSSGNTGEPAIQVICLVC